MKMSGITNIYIENVLRGQTNTFKGVFSCNNIPINFISEKHASIICNLAKENEVGTHFISIIQLPEFVIYIDPFGAPCVNRYILNTLGKCGKPVFYNNKTIQSLCSNFCGYFAMLFIIHFDQNNTMLCFSKDLYKNDALCIQYLVKKLKPINTL